MQNSVCYNKFELCPIKSKALYNCEIHQLYIKIKGSSAKIEVMYNISKKTKTVKSKSINIFLAYKSYKYAYTNKNINN